MRGYLVGMLVALGVVAIAGGVGWFWLDHRAQALFEATLEVPAENVAVPTDSASLAEGERAAWLRGCHGCHGDSLQGKVFVDEPRLIRLTAPNVTQVVKSYTDAELARTIRHGVSRTGRALLAMPAATFYHLSDADLGRIIAHVRAAPRQSTLPPPTELRLLTRVGLVMNQVPTDAGTMEHRAPRLGDRADTSAAFLGRYLAHTICTECHGLDLHGDATTPALARALGYSRAEFRSLLWDGRSRDGRELDLMARTARSRFVRFHQAEIDAIWAYLNTLAPGAPATAVPPA